VFNASKGVWQWVTTSIDATNPQYGDILAYDPTGTRFTNAIDVNGVMVFDDSTARGSAIPTPSEGMVTYRKDTKLVEAYNGTAFTPVGTILQVISTTKTDSFQSTSTSPTDVTGLAVTITPVSSSSKILVQAYVPFSHLASANNQAGFLQLLRDSTPIILGDSAGSRTRASAATGDQEPTWNHSVGGFHPHITFLDSPNSTSALVYKIQAWQTAGLGVTVNKWGADQSNDNVRYARMASTITVMEVAG